MDGYELLITTDQNMRYQQNLSASRLGILVLLSTSWPRIQLRIGDIQAVVDGMQPGDYREVPIWRLVQTLQPEFGNLIIYPSNQAQRQP